MTSPSPVDPIAPTLPGVDPSSPSAGRLEAAVEATLTALDDAGLLEPRHAALAELCRTLARTVTIGVASRRSTGAAMAARELREALGALPAPPEGDGSTDEWERLRAQLEVTP